MRRVRRLLRRGATAALFTALLGPSREAAAQTSPPPASEGCWLCTGWRDEAVVLGASAAVGFGITVGVARLQGGAVGKEQPIMILLASMAGTVALGVAAHSDLARFEDTLTGAAIGGPIGLGIGLLVGHLTDRDHAAPVAGSIVGFGLGILAGGAIGAIAHEPSTALNPSGRTIRLVSATVRW